MVSVVAVVAVMASHFKAIMEAMPSIREFFKGISKWWFNNAIFRADVLKKLEVLQLQNNEIRDEVRMNGGKYKMRDAVQDLQEGQRVMMSEIKHLRGLRDISDKFDSKMNFKYDPEQGATFISESFLTAFGCKESDVLYYAFSEMIHAEDRAEMWEKWQRACEKKTPFSDEQRIRDAAGNYIKCYVKAIPIVIDGKIKEFKGVIEVI